jgi:hypothetical protein
LRGSSGSGLISLERGRCQSVPGWGREFDDPIELPDGGELVTLTAAGAGLAGGLPFYQKIPSSQDRSLAPSEFGF